MPLNRTDSTFAMRKVYHHIASASARINPLSSTNTGWLAVSRSLLPSLNITMPTIALGRCYAARSDRSQTLARPHSVPPSRYVFDGHRAVLGLHQRPRQRSSGPRPWCRRPRSWSCRRAGRAASRTRFGQVPSKTCSIGHGVLMPCGLEPFGVRANGKAGHQLSAWWTSSKPPNPVVVRLRTAQALLAVHLVDAGAGVVGGWRSTGR